MRKSLIPILALVAIALPSKAAEFDIYGKMYPSAWVTKSERFYNDSVPIYYCTLWPYGTLGFKSKGDKIGICIEVGIQQAMYEGVITTSLNTPLLQVREDMIVYAKKFYAEWYINDWLTLLIGQDDGPASFYPSDQKLFGWNCFSNTGALWTGRNAMFQLAFGSDLSADDLEAGFFWQAQAAAIKVDSVAVYVQGKESTFSESKFPKFEGSLGLHFEKAFFATGLKFGGGYQRYFLTAQHANVLKDEDNKIPVDCYVLGFETKAKLGPVTVAYDWAWGQNLGSYGVYIGNPFVWRGMGLSDVIDIFYPRHDKDIQKDEYYLANGKAVEMCGILNVKPLDQLSFEAGYGYIHAEHDYRKYDSLWHDTHAYYAHVQVKIAEILSVTPEFGQYFYGPKTGYGRFTYWGIELGVEF